MEERKEYTYEKTVLRRELSKKRAEATDITASENIAERVLPLVSGNVSVYVSIGSEVRTEFLINALLRRSDVTVFVPYTHGGKIFQRRLKSLGRADKLGNLDESGYFLPFYEEKDDAPIIDCCITPLLGVNARGYRLGYGKGCYDRYFAEHPTYKIGLAYDVQRAEFAEEAHDIALDCCVTPSEVIYYKS